MSRRALRTALCLALLAAPAAAVAQTGPGAAKAATIAKGAQRPAPKTHRIVVQVTQNDPAMMTLALNNVENMTRYFESKDERAEIEVVAYGPGLAMMRSDVSPVKDRLAALAKGNRGIVFTGCANTMANQSKQEGRELSLVPEARLVPAGIARVVELQEEGWTYVRP